MSGPLDGRCLCGAARYTCSGEAILTLVCHCTDCQHQTGTAFSTLVAPTMELWTRSAHSYATLAEQVRSFARGVGPAPSL